MVGSFSSITQGQWLIQQLQSGGGMHRAIMTMHVLLKFRAGPVPKDTDFPPAENALQRGCGDLRLRRMEVTAHECGVCGLSPDVKEGLPRSSRCFKPVSTTLRR